VLLYKQDGSLYCVTKKALQLAGFQTLADFLAKHRDYSELFVKKPGYIYNFENFSWINFLKHATPQQKKILLKNRDGAIFSCDVDFETYYPLEAPTDKPVEYYEITIKNVTLLDDAGNVAADQPVFDAEPTPAAGMPPQPDGLDAPAFPPSEEEQLFSLVQEETPAGQEEEESLPELKEEGLIDFTQALSEPQTEQEAAPSAQETVSASVDTEERIAIEPIQLDSLPKQPEQAEEEKPDTPESEDVKDEGIAMVEISLNEETPVATDTVAPLPFDTEKIARLIGFDIDQTKLFLEEFVREFKERSERIEKGIREGDMRLVKKEVLRIKGVAGNLMLGEIEKGCEALLGADEPGAAEKAFNLLKNSVLSESAETPVEPVSSAEENEPVFELLEEESETAPEEPPRPSESQNDDGPLPLLLEDESPLVSEETAASSPESAKEEEEEDTVLFDPKAAADALGLPADLILEFTHDFITQCHDEKESFQKAIEAGDIQTVNTTAHKLKGVAANLRIENLRELLKKIQYTQDTQMAKELVEKLYTRVEKLQEQMKEMS